MTRNVALGQHFFLVDNKSIWLYNSIMLKNRKKRSDRNHVVYCVTNIVTNEQYVGITAIAYKGNVKKTLHRRMQKHLQRSLTENKDWGLCQSLRNYGPDNFSYGVLEIVRGKKLAHSRETFLINTCNPSLNTFKRGM
jgi:group I intron endonuclease